MQRKIEKKSVYGPLQYGAFADLPKLCNRVVIHSRIVWHFLIFLALGMWENCFPAIGDLESSPWRDRPTHTVSSTAN